MKKHDKIEKVQKNSTKLTKRCLIWKALETRAYHFKNENNRGFVWLSTFCQWIECKKIIKYKKVIKIWQQWTKRAEKATIHCVIRMFMNFMNWWIWLQTKNNFHSDPLEKIWKVWKNHKNIKDEWWMKWVGRCPCSGRCWSPAALFWDYLDYWLKDTPAPIWSAMPSAPSLRITK